MATRCGFVRWTRGIGEEPVELRGLALHCESVPVEPNSVPPFQGTVTLKGENFGRNHDR